MPSDKQIQASRTNGARSKGPVTDQGKRNSSRNSLRHGLLARTVVLEEECAERFYDLLDSYLDEYRPRTATQLTLVETMAAARWRQFRVWGVQKSALDRDIALQNELVGPPAVRAVSSFGGPRDVTLPADLLLRYDTAYDRQFARALAQLTALQSKPAPGNPAPYHPESPGGHTWKDPRPQRAGRGLASGSGDGPQMESSVLRDSRNAKRTQEVIETAAEAPESSDPPSDNDSRCSENGFTIPPWNRDP
jgi:hypothetical protein